MHALADFMTAHAFWSWAALAAVLLAGEVGSMTGYLLWPAAAAGVIAVTHLFAKPGLPVDLLVFAVVTIVLTLISKRILPQHLRQPGPDINDRARGLIGRSGQSVGDFAGGRGRVFVDGAEWIAESDETAAPPTAGSTVKVIDVLGGGRLKVTPA
jgi:hypothetical protein